MLKDKHILLGVTGSIAAYKAAMLVRLLVREGAQVRVVMTRSARDFITPLTLATLCKYPVLVDNFDPTSGAWNSHIALGEWADYYLIAPATANTLAKMAGGIADNLLLTSYLSARCPVGVAPAMDVDMYGHAAMQDNLAVLRDRGVAIIEPGEGELASGLIGKGRMAEVEHIVAILRGGFSSTDSTDSMDSTDHSLDRSLNRTLEGKRFLVTAGATVEAIDPVRYISNHSTGKMGYAIARVLAERGGEVTLVSGAVQVDLPARICDGAYGGAHDGVCGRVRLVRVVSAEDMYEACDAVFDGVDGAVFCAAVADYTPVKVQECKIKHFEMHNEDGEIMLALQPTRDIAAQMGRRKRMGQVTIGFALESADGREAVGYARSKLKDKNLDAIVLNSLKNPGAGFGGDTNRVTIIDASGEEMPIPLKSKAALAQDIVDFLARRLLVP